MNAHSTMSGSVGPKPIYSKLGIYDEWDIQVV
jgi:hypothetical protein